LQNIFCLDQEISLADKRQKKTGFSTLKKLEMTTETSGG